MGPATAVAIRDAILNKELSAEAACDAALARIDAVDAKGPALHAFQLVLADRARARAAAAQPQRKQRSVAVHVAIITCVYVCVCVCVCVWPRPCRACSSQPADRPP